MTAEVVVLGLAATVLAFILGSKWQQAKTLRRRDQRQDLHNADKNEQHLTAQLLRRRAREAIDDTGAVISERLQEVVLQVSAAAEAADGTRDRVKDARAANEMAIRRARDADEVTSALNASLHQVAGVSTVISQIASQTRLLALNATIEAARAGAAGKGFAVVAGEVKNLADSTAVSAEQITQTVATLETDVGRMGHTLTAIVDDVKDIESAMGSLGGFADEQQQIVHRLNGTIHATMVQLQDLSEVAEQLEQRRAERLSTSGAARMRIGNRSEQIDVRMIDLSTGGLGLYIPPTSPAVAGDRVTVWFPVGGADCEATATVRWRVDNGDETEVGLQFVGLSAAARETIHRYVSAQSATTSPEASGPTVPTR